MSGKLIVLEGPDGTGKSTQAKLLVDYLVRMATPYVFAKQPSHGPVGQLLRRVLTGEVEDPGSRALALLFAADRAHQADALVRPALARGDVVLADRYYHASMAYQTDGSDPQAREVRGLNADAPVPDLTILFHLPVELAAARVKAKAGSVELFDDLPAQRAVAKAYGNMKRWLPGERVVRVDAGGTIEQVHRRVMKATEGLI